MYASLDRSPSQRAELVNKATAGSGESAYELAIYYEFVAFDHARAMRWLERGAALRYRPAMESLANMLDDSAKAEDRRRARRIRHEAQKLPEV